MEFTRNLYAGLDRDRIVKLFVIEGDREPRLIDHSEWLNIISGLNLEPGEMPIVRLSKGQSKNGNQQQ